MKGFWGLGLSAALATVMSSSAVLGQDVPTGWHLHEEDMGGVTDLMLAWYVPEERAVAMSINCQEGYGDVVLTVYVDGPAAPDAAPANVVLEQDGTRFAFESEVSDYNGFSVGTITSFGPELTALLKGGFAVSIDGKPHGTFEPKSGKGEIARILEACPAG